MYFSVDKMERIWLFCNVFVLIIQFTASNSSDDFLLNISCEYSEMTEFMEKISGNHSTIAKLVSIGKSEEGRDIWTMIVSDSPNKRPLLRPQVKFVGNVNGMSGPACYLLLRLIKHLVEEYANESSMERKLMENMEIHIIPNLNPDGYAKASSGSCYGKEGRLNANKVNLNTNFPDLFSSNDEPFYPIQKETEAIMRWMDQNMFTISVSVISGAQVVSYPFDGVIEDEHDHIPYFGPHFTPDDDVFKHLSLKYAEKTGAPEQGWYCPQLERNFPNGIINGAEWKPQSGTMMDYNYIHGTFEIMVGVSCCRNENNRTVLENIWWRNREGLLHVIHEVEGGIRGQVLDSETYDAIPGAKLYKRRENYSMQSELIELELPWYTSSEGEFWRPWRPGRYILRVEKNGYKMKEILVDVHRRQPTFLRVELEKMESMTISAATTTTTETSKPTTTTTTKDQAHKALSSNKLSDEDEEDAIYPVTKPFNYPLDASTPRQDLTQDLTNTKQYSFLTQLDHSFINLFKRFLHLRNSAAMTFTNSSLFPLKMLILAQFYIYRVIY